MIVFLSVIYIIICAMMIAAGGLYFVSELVMMGIGYYIYHNNGKTKEHTFWYYWILGTLFGCIGLIFGLAGALIGPIIRFVYLYFFAGVYVSEGFQDQTNTNTATKDVISRGISTPPYNQTIIKQAPPLSPTQKQNMEKITFGYTVCPACKSTDLWRNNGGTRIMCRNCGEFLK